MFPVLVVLMTAVAPANGMDHSLRVWRLPVLTTRGAQHY